MALAPASCDPNRRKELERIKKLASESEGAEKVKQEFNMDLDDNTKLDVKDPETNPKSKTPDKGKK